MEYVRFTKHAEDGCTPIEAVLVRIPDDAVGQDETAFIVERLHGTEAIYAACLTKAS